MSGQEKGSTQCGQTRKKAGGERERVEEKKEKKERQTDIQHLNRNKRNVSHTT